jgi:hypothetical protein
MRWSQLKKRIEANFAESVAGRVEVWNTLYRKSHDQEGEAWVTIDKQRVWSMATYTYFAEAHREAMKLSKESFDFGDPEQRQAYWKARDQADKIVRARGVCRLWEVNGALFDFLNLSIDDAIKSDNPIIRAFATLDRRFGRRRLADFDNSQEHALVKTLYRFRCKA